MSGVNIQVWTLCLFYIFVGQENEFNIYVAKPILKKKIQKLQNVIAPKLQNIKQKMLSHFFFCADIRMHMLKAYFW